MEFHKAVLRIRKKGAMPKAGSSIRNIKAETARQALDTADRRALSTAKARNEFYEVPVQYNPSSLSFHINSGGGDEEEEPGKKKAWKTGSQKDVSGGFRVELMIDSANNQTAFLEASRDAKYRSGGKLAEAVNEESVRAQAESLVALLMRPETRQIVFCWNNLVYVGELQSVGIRYTMFNPSGNPVRANISLELSRSFSGAGSAMALEEEKHWDGVLDKFVKAGGGEKVNVINSLDGVTEAMNKGSSKTAKKTLTLEQ